MDFYNDATITVPFLQEQLFADQTDAESQRRRRHARRDVTCAHSHWPRHSFSSHVRDLDECDPAPFLESLRVIDSFRSALQLAATQNWSVEQSTQYFQSGGLTEEQTEAVATVWKKEQKNVHDLLVAASGFSTPHFAALNWRLDVQSHARYVAEMNRPTAVVQISTKVRGGGTTTTERMRQTAYSVCAPLPAVPHTVPCSVLSLCRPVPSFPSSPQSTVGSTQLEFELDRTSVANVLLEMEKIDAIFAAAQ